MEMKRTGIVLALLFLLAFCASTLQAQETWAWNENSASLLLAMAGDDDDDDDDDQDDDDDDDQDDDQDDDDDDQDEDDDDDDDDDDDVFTWKKSPEYKAIAKRERALNRQIYVLLKANGKLQNTKHSKKHAPTATDVTASPVTDDLRANLRKLVADQFQVRQERRAYELKILQAQVEQMQKDNEYRNANADKIIDKRVDFLLDTDDAGKF